MDQELSELLEQQSFRNNPNLRPEGTKIAYTKEMIEEYIKCREDPLYFIENYINIVHPDRGIVKMELYEYQQRMIMTYHENRYSIGMTARQMGKCLCINSKVKIRNKKTDKIIEITLGDFYEWEAFRQTWTDEVLRELRERISDSEKKGLFPNMLPSTETKNP